MRRVKVLEIFYFVCYTELTLFKSYFVCYIYNNRLVYLLIEKKLLFLQVPLLEIDGKNLVQSSAIARYICRKGNLLGDNEDDMTK
jgi:hypothetical protein